MKAGKAQRPQRKASAAAPLGDELDHVFAVVARHFAMLSEPMRLKILHTICQDERSVSAIVAATGATQTNVSRHLALMLHAGGDNYSDQPAPLGGGGARMACGVAQ